MFVYAFRGLNDDYPVHTETHIISTINCTPESGGLDGIPRQEGFVPVRGDGEDDEGLVRAMPPSPAPCVPPRPILLNAA